MNTPIRVAVVDDHQLFREGVIELLATMTEVRVVGQGGTAAEAVALAVEQHPDVMLLDLDMPDTVGGSAHRAGATAQRVLDASPDTRVVVLTMHDSAALVRELLVAGASGYLLKSAGRDELLSAVKTAARQTGSVTFSLSRGAALALSSREHRRTSLLTPRETEVLELLANGGSNRQIARDLQITEATVKRHLATVFRKLDATSRISAVNAAHRLGVLEG